MSSAPRLLPTAGGERRVTLSRFGGRVELRVSPAPGKTAQAQQRLDRAAELLAEFDRRLSRFDPASELCRLNAHPRGAVPASPLMLRFAEAVSWAGRTSGGLVDATCLPAVERAGYTSHLTLPAAGAAGVGHFAPEPAALQLLAPEAPVSTDEHPGTWRDIVAGPTHVDRPVGVRLDSGGIGKGLAADLAAEFFRDTPAWMVDCGGDLRIGGTDGAPRPVDVRDPLDPGRVIHRLHVTSGGVATSGITRRSWTTTDGAQHHLIDPRTGRPAETGILQVTALAPTALEAEVLAKTALLSGPELAHRRLTHGGIIVCANGTVMVIPPPAVHRAPRVRQRRRAAFRVPGRPTALRVIGNDR